MSKISKLTVLLLRSNKQEEKEKLKSQNSVKMEFKAAQNRETKEDAANSLSMNRSDFP